MSKNTKMINSNEIAILEIWRPLVRPATKIQNYKKSSRILKPILDTLK